MTHIIKKGFNQRSQSLHFRKGQYDPTTQSVPDESFLNGDARDVQDGRYYKGDGVGAYVNTGVVDKFVSSTGVFEIRLYLKLVDYTASNASIFAANSFSVGNQGWGLFYDNRSNNRVFQFTIYGQGNRYVNIQVSNSVSDNEWHKLEAKGDGSNAELLLDDAVIGSQSIPALPSGDGDKNTYLLTNPAIRYFEDFFLHDFNILNPNKSSENQIYKCDEGGGTTAFDSSGNGYHGTINNANLSTFHASGDDAPYSFQNNVGYTYDSVNDRYIPRDESNTDKDVQGNNLQFKGKVPYTVYAKDSNCGKFDGVGSFVDTTAKHSYIHQTANFKIKFRCKITDLSSTGVVLSNNDDNNQQNGAQVNFNPFGNQDFVLFLTINGSGAISAGLNTPAVTDNEWHIVEFIGNGSNVSAYLDGNVGELKSANFSNNNIADTELLIGNKTNASLYFDGQLTDVNITNPNNQPDNGHYAFSEGNDNFVYDVSGNGYHGEIKNASITDFWSERQDVFHYNIEHGFDLWLDGSNNKLFVPFDENGNSIKTQGDTISGWTWDSKHEPSTNFHNGAETRFDTDANDPHFGDYKRAVSDTGLHPSNNVSGDDRYYIRKLPDGEADRFTLYLNDQVDPQKLKTQLFTQ